MSVTPCTQHTCHLSPPSQAPHPTSRVTIAAMNHNSILEYVCITMSAGAVYSVTPENANTKTALEAGKNGGLVHAINKMAESGYQLLEGTSLVMDCAISGASVAVFMYRER
jgi:hypothetical protein